jgi:hypothetical protein
MFTTLNRPLLGVDVAQTYRDEAKQQLTLIIHLKNFGNMVAKNVETQFNIFVQGVAQPMTQIPYKPSIHFPQVSHLLVGGLGSAKYSGVISGQLTWEYSVDIKYSGFDGQQYFTSQRGRYIAEINTFAVTDGTAD